MKNNMIFNEDTLYIEPYYCKKEEEVWLKILYLYQEPIKIACLWTCAHGMLLMRFPVHSRMLISQCANDIMPCALPHTNNVMLCA